MPIVDSTKSKHQRISDYIRDAISSGKYTPGQQVPTEPEIGALFDACRQTVSQALRELVNEGLLTRRRGAGTFVCRRPAISGTTLGLLWPEVPGGIFAPICAELARTVRSAGFRLLLEGVLPLRRRGDAHVLPATPFESDDEARVCQIEALCREYVAHGIAGVFFPPFILPADADTVNMCVVEAFEGAGIPVILLDRDVCDYPGRSRFDLVGVANRRCSQVLTEHLLRLGHRRIEYISQRGQASTVTARVAGYQDALRNHGIVPDPSWVHAIDAREFDAVRGLLKNNRAEAFVCVNDHVAAHLMRHLLALGVRIPDDVAMVGFDDIEFATLVPVPLTTMRQPCERIGEAAAKLMLERLADPSLPAREISFDCELVVRQSCGANRQERCRG